MGNSFRDIFRISVSPGNKLKWDNFLLLVLAKGKKNASVGEGKIEDGSRRI